MEMPRDPVPGGFSDDDLGYGPYTRMANATRHDHWWYSSIYGWNSWIVVLMAVVFTTAIVFASIPLFIHHIYVAAIAVLILAIVNLCYWSTQ